MGRLNLVTGDMVAKAEIMPMPKQKHNESDADYAVRVNNSREAQRKSYRKWYAANRERVLEAQRKSYEANPDRKLQRQRARREEKALAFAKGKPLNNNFTRAPRPKILSRLIVEKAHQFCETHGLPAECAFDTDTLRAVAREIREAPCRDDGTRNPWYCTEYLCEALISTTPWSHHIKRTWSKS